MTPAQLSRTVLRTVRRAVEDGELRVAVPERIVVRRPPRPGDGDYATNVALRLASEAGRSARSVAETLRARLVDESGIVGVEISGPGFLNITVAGEGRATLVAELIREGGAGTAHRAAAPEEDPRRDAVRWLAATTGASPTGVAVAHSGADEPAHAGTHARADRVAAPPARPAPVPASARPAPAPARPAPAPEQDSDPFARLLVQREGNPLFLVRYAHARARALLRNAHDLGFGPEPGEDAYQAPEADELLSLLADHQRIEAADDPRRLARHLHLVANAFLRFHPACPPLPSGDEKPGAAHRARLALVQATGAVLAGGLYRLGVSAPEHL